MYKVQTLSFAKNDLAANLRYIRNVLCNPQAALSLHEDYKKRLKTLAEMPLGFALVQDEDLAARGIRSLPVKNYRIFYTVDDTAKKVWIIRFIHGSRDWPNLPMSTTDTGKK